MLETVKVIFTDILDYKSGSASLTKQYISEHRGPYPVYSAKTIGETKVGEIGSYMFDVEGLQLTTNGANAGTWLYRNKHKFSLNGDARLYYPKKEYELSLDIKYLFYALKAAFSTKDFDWNTKATISNTRNIKVEIPVLPSGEFDLQKQKELARIYDDIERQKSALLQKNEELKQVKIKIDSDDTIRYENVPILKLFKPKGGDMRLSKTYCKENTGIYPVYSGSTDQEVFGNINEYKYNGEYLTWVIDGLAGYVMKLTGYFSITCHRGILLPTKDCQNIDLLYVKYMIEPIFRKRARGRIGINGKNEYTALKPSHIISYNDTIPIPIDDNGKYDISKQRELARKFSTIEILKENICNQISALTSIVVI